MIWAASSAVVSRLAACGSADIHAVTSEAVRSSPEPAARSTSRSVRMPARNDPCMTTTDPTLARTIPAAAWLTVVSGATVTTLVFIRSLSCVIVPSGSGGRAAGSGAARSGSAAVPDLVEFGVEVRSGRSRHLLGQHAPQRAGPCRQAGPPLPEHLQRGRVELLVRLFRRQAPGEFLEVMYQVEEPVANFVHTITSPRV